MGKMTRNRAHRNVKKERVARELAVARLKDARLKGFQPASTGDMLSLVSKQPVSRRSGRR